MTLDTRTLTPKQPTCKNDMNVSAKKTSIYQQLQTTILSKRLKKQIDVDFGSGYMSDPKTKDFLEKHYADFPYLFRRLMCLKGVFWA